MSKPQGFACNFHSPLISLLRFFVFFFFSFHFVLFFYYISCYNPCSKYTIHRRFEKEEEKMGGIFEVDIYTSFYR
jgi:hypothetical protein